MAGVVIAFRDEERYKACCPVASWFSCMESLFDLIRLKSGMFEPACRQRYVIGNCVGALGDS